MGNAIHGWFVRGGTTFMVQASGSTAQKAFQSAVKEAHYEYGHRGYTGTIAEKNSFTMISCPKDTNPSDFADNLIDEGDPRINDKWGPAGCIALGKNRYLFFGWASK
jgi:hypothetical protein